MADKKKTLKTYKTAAGAQQYGDTKAWKELDNKIKNDFLEMKPDNFKEKYGEDKYKLFRKIQAGYFGARSKDEEGYVKHLAETYEKDYTKASKKPSYARGGVGTSGKAKAKKAGTTGENSRTKRNYASGGYANCGASMKPTQKSSMK